MDKLTAFHLVVTLRHCCSCLTQLSVVWIRCSCLTQLSVVTFFQTSVVCVSPDRSFKSYSNIVEIVAPTNIIEIVAPTNIIEIIAPTNIIEIVAPTNIVEIISTNTINHIKQTPNQVKSKNFRQVF